MDLHGIEHFVTAPDRGMLDGFGPGDAWLGGGTWLFSEPQPGLRRLIDLQGFGWRPIEEDASGLTIAATCTLAELHNWQAPAGWTAAPLAEACCRALLGSFKVWNRATVGGNLCMALPAGPMTSLATALQGRCTIWMPSGGERQLPALEFVTGNRRNALRPGEVLRSIWLPALELSARAAFRQISLTPAGRSGALVIATLREDNICAITVTASTTRPVRLAFYGVPCRAELAAMIGDRITGDLWHDDVHGRPDWRQRVTLHLAEEVRRELVGGTS